MKIDISEITGILKQEIRRYEAGLDVVKVGRVLGVGDGIARIDGLPDALAGEMLLFEDDTIGEVFDLEEDFLAVVLYGDFTKVREGSEVRIDRAADVRAGRQGDAWAGGESAGAAARWRAGDQQQRATAGGYPIAPGIADRQPVNEPLQTGLKASTR